MAAERVIIDGYLYRSHEKPPDVVLAGSSRTHSLKASLIDTGIVNLGLAGQSSTTAVEIVRRTPSKPHILLVEASDALELGENQQLLSDIFEPHRRWLREHFSMLRDEYQPVSVLLDALRARRESKSIRAAAPEAENPAYTRLINQEWVAKESRPPSMRGDMKLTILAEALRVKIDALRSSGPIRVILFEVPQSTQVDGSPGQQRVRAILHRVFPVARYEWLPPPPARNWKTQDGVHLLPADAAVFTRYIEDYLSGRDSRPKVGKLILTTQWISQMNSRR